MPANHFFTIIILRDSLSGDISYENNLIVEIFDLLGVYWAYYIIHLVVIYPTFNHS